MKPVVVSFHCATVDEPFEVALAQSQKSEGFRIKEIRAPRMSVAAPVDGDSEAEEAHTLPDGDVDWTGFKCHWCETRSFSTAKRTTAFVECGACGTLSCAAACSESDEGDTFFECPSCGNSGVINRTIESYSGADDADTLQISGPPKKRLNAPSSAGASR